MYLKSKKERNRDSLSPGELLREYVFGQLTFAANSLRCPKHKLNTEIHSARKALRHAVAALDLGRKSLTPRCEPVRTAAKKACSKWSRIRDADAVIEALDRKIEKQKSHSRVQKLKRLRSSLSATSARLLRIELTKDPKLSNYRTTLGRLGQKVLLLPWESITTKDIERSLKKSRRRVKRVKQKAKRQNTDAARHRWRRRARKLLHELDAAAWMMDRSHEIRFKDMSKGRLDDLVRKLGRERDSRMLRDRIHQIGNHARQ